MTTTHPTIRTEARVRDVVTIALLAFGVLIFAVGWFVGVALLWTSPTWQLRDKLVGTLVIPGGLPFALIVAGFGVPVTVANQVPWLVLTFQTLIVIAPIYTAVQLSRSIFRDGRATHAAAIAHAFGKARLNNP